MLKVPLYKSYIYWPLIFLVVTILTAINNYAFYETREKTIAIEQKNTIDLYNALFKDCRSKSIPQSQCGRFLNKIIRASNSPHETLIIGSNKKPFVDIRPKKKFSDNRKNVVTKKKIGLTTYVLTRASTPPLWSSVLSSMTFSFSDYLQQDYSNLKEIYRFTINTAWPRSRHSFLFLLAVLLLFKFFRAQQRILLNDLAKTEQNLTFLQSQYAFVEEKIVLMEEKLINSTASEDQLNQSIHELKNALITEQFKIQELTRIKQEKILIEKRLKETIDQKDKLQAEKDQATGKLKSHTQKLLDEKKQLESQYQKELASLNSQLVSKNGLMDDSELKIMELEEKIQSLTKSFQETKEHKLVLEKELSYYRKEKVICNQQIDKVQRNVDGLESKSDLGASFRKRLIEALIRNPNIASVSSQHKINEGKHHGKEYIIRLNEQLKEHPSILNFCETITTTEFQPALRGQARLLKSKDKNRYIINLYFDDDRGVAAEIMLSASHYWEAVLQTKCIFSVIKHLQKIKIKIKDQTP